MDSWTPGLTIGRQITCLGEPLYLQRRLYHTADRNHGRHFWQSPSEESSVSGDPLMTSSLQRVDGLDDHDPPPRTPDRNPTSSGDPFCSVLRGILMQESDGRPRSVVDRSGCASTLRRLSGRLFWPQAICRNQAIGQIGSVVPHTHYAS